MGTSNPYSYRRPIQDSKDFFGRSLELAQVQEAIDGKACVSFVGEPRSGLTSLLLHIAGEPFRTRCAAISGPLKFVYVDCTVVGENPLTLLRRLLEQIDTPPGPIPNWRMAFGRLVAAVDALLPTRLAVIFDDFECIGRDEAYADLTDHLRALSQRSDMMLVTATHTELKNCCHMKVVSSPFPNMFHVEYLGPFSRPEAEDFIKTTSVRSQIDLCPHQERILSLSGLHPYYLQMACGMYFEALQADHHDETAVDNQFLNTALPSFDGIWLRLEAKEQKALSALAAEDRSLETSDIELPTSLYRRGYLRRDGSSGEPRLFSRAFRDYARGR